MVTFLLDNRRFNKRCRHFRTFYSEESKTQTHYILRRHRHLSPSLAGRAFPYKIIAHQLWPLLELRSRKTFITRGYLVPSEPGQLSEFICLKSIPGACLLSPVICGQLPCGSFMGVVFISTSRTETFRPQAWSCIYECCTFQCGRNLGRSCIHRYEYRAYDQYTLAPLLLVTAGLWLQSVVGLNRSYLR